MPERSNIGLRANDLRTDVKNAISQARRLAFSALELGVDSGEVTPDALSESGRRHLARLVRSEGLSLAALASDARGVGIADPGSVDELVNRTGSALRLAGDMGVSLFSHDVGEILSLSDAERATAVEALRALAEQAERFGTVYAIRSRAGAPDEVSRLVKTVDCPLVRVAIDPAALLMSGFDPLESLGGFGEQLVLAYVRDATRGSAEHVGHETALGQGRLELDAYLAGVDAAGCGSAPILRRTDTANPVGDLAADQAILRAHVNPFGR